ncbi:MAG TPA: hypothetical protein VK660_04740 [Xanthomonadaceae bacterium]|jgi:hypothetical protein|nr:hypothetical protein [Xanthomonadaceae bacterium]
MRQRLLIVSLIAGLALAAPMVFAQQFSSVEERMSSSDFKAAGLDKLSPEELAKLNDFIKHEVDTRTAQAHEVGARENDNSNIAKIGFKHYEGKRDEIVSRIPGTFTGWTGHSTFTLENGQVWRQADPDSELVGVRLVNPEVHITPGFLGTWQLHVEGYGTFTKVERVQ